MTDKRPKVMRIETDCEFSSPGSSIPRGMEVLIKKAAIDPQFRQILLEKRAGAADTIGLVLDPTEVAMLTTIPESQLFAIIVNTTVSPRIKAAFMGCVAAVMLAALGCDAHSAEQAERVTEGIRPDTNYVQQQTADNIPKTTGTIKGSVTDQRGVAINAATVNITLKWILTSAATGEKVAPSRTVEFHIPTDDNGLFSISTLPVGIYAVEVVRQAFHTQELSEVQVSEGATTEVSFQLVNWPQYNNKGGARPHSIEPSSTDGARPAVPPNSNPEGE